MTVFMYPIFTLMQPAENKGGSVLFSTWMSHSECPLGFSIQTSAASPGEHKHLKVLFYLPAQLNDLNTLRHFKVVYLHVDIPTESFISQSLRDVCDRWG